MVGTHHIFFPPRLEAMVRESDSRCLSSELRRDSSFHRFGRHEPHAPARAALGRGAANHRDHGSLLGAVQELHRSWSRIVAQRALEAAR